MSEYFRILDSPELKEFLQFEKSADFKKLGDPKAVKESEELQRMKKYEKGKEYQTYLRFHDSYKLKEYKELQEKISNEEFKKKNAFWSDSKRWDKTEEAAIENRYFELCKNEDIIFYQKINAKDIEMISKMNLIFEEQCEWNTLNASRWEFGFHHPSEEIKQNYSHINEKQANNDGENISVNNGVLNLSVKKENKNATAWDPTIGFVDKQYEYTGDVIHGRNAICQKGGIFAAKIRFTGSKEVTHTFSLKGDTQAPIITVSKCSGKKIEVGVHWQSKFENKVTSTTISGINPSEFFIYSVMWTGTELVWYINNLEVFRTSEGLPSDPMYPILNSFISEQQKGGEGNMEIDWIEVFEVA